MSIFDKYPRGNTIQSDVINAINDDNDGIYVITTTTGSRYVVDVDSKTVTRHPADESDWHGDLRRASTHHILNPIHCVVGERMQLVIDNIIPDLTNEIGLTFTTVVVSIEEIS